MPIHENLTNLASFLAYSRLLEQLEEAGLVDKNLLGAAKHSRRKGLLNPISIAGGLDNPLVEVEQGKTKQCYPYNTRRKHSENSCRIKHRTIQVIRPCSFYETAELFA